MTNGQISEVRAEEAPNSASEQTEPANLHQVPPDSLPEPEDEAHKNEVSKGESERQEEEKPGKGEGENEAQTLKVPEWRKSSTVSFKDVAELFEIDLEANGRAERPAAVFSLRFYIMILALVSPFVVTYSKTIINFAIIDMIEPTHLGGPSKGAAGAGEPERAQAQQELATTRSASARATLYDWPQGENVHASSGYAPTINTQQEAYFDLDNSCPVEASTRARLLDELNEDEKQARGGQSERFEWDTVKQGLLKAAYSIGHMLLQVAGGRLSEIYGSHLIMGSSAALIGLSCLGAPLLASTHFYLLFADLFLLGLLGSFMTPALITLFSNWLTPSEKSIMLSFYLVSSRLGYALSSLLCGLLIQAQLSWRYLFYSAGWLSLAFSLLFFLCARSRPHEHPLISALELDYLASKNTLVREAIARSGKRPAGAPKNSGPLKMSPVASAQSGHKQVKLEIVDGDAKRSEHASETKLKTQAKQAPWLAILTNRSVWAFIVTKFCVKLAGDTVQIELPTYLKRVMHLGARHNGIINASNYVIFCASCLLVGWLARLANKRHPFGWTKTTVRKLFQCTASAGVGLSLLGVAYFVCNETATLILLMAIFFFTTFGTGGEAQIPLDISERYAGTIHALGSQLAISGVIEPILVGFVLRDSPADRHRWAAVWMGASGVAFLGGLSFALLADATIQPFDKINLERERERETTAPNSASNKTKEGRATSVQLKGQVNGSFQMRDERQSVEA